ncbi:unnamed protein product [Vitrella brassicaformis CCMP3155]|uniref:Uncharacterized protein n=1 Tax=Vitrella brassicaformis (strain CCMP3155) TaxID=1169540 RepID=A0A0G4EVS0_VITBC|nr:unnamed protein product [Vitrella brassicaformis CCMP3155]|eukprot:CEM02527.1 unnamed protein product [Vitrella brassicaformis CCMP3155]
MYAFSPKVLIFMGSYDPPTQKSFTRNSENEKPGPTEPAALAVESLAVVEVATMLSDLEQKHSEISCLMYRLSALDASDLSSHDCSLHMIAALYQYAKLKASLKALVKSATFPQRRTAASAKLDDLSADAMARLQTSTDLQGVGCLKTTAPLVNYHVKMALRRRLTVAVDKAGLTGVVRFAPQLGDGGVMKALWLMEEGGSWGEVGNGLRVAGQCGYCQLPITIDAVDLQKHDTKTAYLSMPRVTAQWMVVGRHVAFRRANGQQDGTFELFRDNTINEIRTIRDEPGFAITLNPPLSTNMLHPLQQHPFQQHIKPDDLPVYDAGGGYLDGVLTRSPHTPLDGCSAIVASAGGDAEVEHIHLLTAFDDPFTAWVQFWVVPDDRQNVSVTLVTTEQPVGSPGDPFPARYQRTAWLARRSLGPVAPVLLDGQAP